MKHDYFWGADIGLTVDPTGVVLLRAVRPAVTVQDGRVLDATTGKELAVPEGVTIAEFIAPKYAIVDAQSRRGLTFHQVAREAAATMEDLGGGNFTACIDATGLGVGALDAVRRAGCPAVGITFTSGRLITGSRWNWNLPVSLMFTGLFSVMAQGRLQVTDPAGAKLIEELKEIEMRVSDTGKESFDVGSGQDHHGDLCYALGMAVTVAERRVGRQHRNIALHPGGHRRRAGRPRQGQTGRKIIKARLEQSRLQSEATMWAQIGVDKDPDFD